MIKGQPLLLVSQSNFHHKLNYKFREYPYLEGRKNDYFVKFTYSFANISGLSGTRDTLDYFFSKESS